MTPEDIESRAKSVLSDVLGLGPESMGADTSADTVEEWDSLQHLTIVLSLEEEFDIAFDEEETVAVTSLPLIVLIVGEKLGVVGNA